MNKNSGIPGISLYYKCIIILMLCGFIAFLMAKPPDDLPGEEITEDQYFDFILPRDSVVKKVPQTSPESPTWLDQAARTWDAPPIEIQLAQDKKKMLMGMGAVYVPYMSDPNLEAEIEIIDSTGDIVVSGKTGRKYSLMPSEYYVMLGSGAHKQKMVKPVIIEENKITPLLPNWCGLSVDVVNEGNYPFRGEYELARIDKFVPFGRGFGRDPDLGEKVKTWILKPGIYKIFGVGQGYNTLTNFVTVRLLPGEFVRFTLVQDENSLEIKGGGVVQMEATSGIASNWKYGIDVGGSVDFNAKYDHDDSSKNTNNKSVSLIFRSNLNYKKEAIEWDNRLWLSEGIDFEEWDLSRLKSSSDEIRFTSLFTWRFLHWLGPYGRFEASSEFFPEYERRPENVPSHYFITFNEDYYLTDTNSVDSTYKTQPPFSPLNLETGIGANINAVKTRFFEARVLSGMGLKYKKVWDESELADTSKIKFSTTEDSLMYDTIVHINNNSFTAVRRFNDEASVEVGPEVVLYMTLKLGRFAIIESEVKYFSPFNRMERPDLTLRSTVSWRLLRMLTLDYEYEYKLKQPAEEALRQNESRHRVLVRFSYTSR